MEKELEVARKLAREAGAILLTYYRGDAQVQWKGHDDPVTAADQAANEMLVQALTSAFPHDAILSEEAPDDTARLDHDRVWMVDPMDGTKQFIEHLDEFAVMIGLAVKGQPLVGVVYNPATDRMFYAAAGLGAYLESGLTTKRLRVAPEADPAKMTAAMSRSHHSPSVDRVRRKLGMTGEKRSGSVGLKIGLIAEAQAHAYIHIGNKTRQWDTCGPVAILQAAGGIVTDNYGAPLDFNTADVRNLTGIVASNGTAHDRIVQAVQEVIQKS
jgi:3'(2'), 5'-bisphosphate nucleotidase